MMETAQGKSKRHRDLVASSPSCIPTEFSIDPTPCPVASTAASHTSEIAAQPDALPAVAKRRKMKHMGKTGYNLRGVQPVASNSNGPEIVCKGWEGKVGRSGDQKISGYARLAILTFTA
jgi:hypothetical protein